MLDKYIKTIKEELSPLYLPVDYEYDVKIMWSIESRNNVKLLKYWMEKLNINPEEASKNTTISVGMNKYALEIRNDLANNVRSSIIFRWYVRQILFKKYNELYILKRDDCRDRVCYNIKTTKFICDFSKYIIDAIRIFLSTRKVSYMDLYITSLLVYSRDVLGDDNVIDRYKKYIDKVVYLP